MFYTFIQKTNADAVLITDLTTIRYLCNFRGSSAVLVYLKTTGKFYFFTDARYTLESQKYVKNCEINIVERGNILKNTVVDFLKTNEVL